MSKRGFGLVQSAAFIAMFILTIIFFVLILLHPEPVNENKVNELQLTYAQIVLDNLFALPVDNPPQGLLGVAPRPTIGDAFVFESADPNLRVQVEEVLNTSFASRGVYWFEWDLVATNNPGFGDYFDVAGPCENRGDTLFTIVRELPTASGSVDLKLYYCEVSS